ncbi:THAP domain-containing protein 1 [Megalopta genalis]|uniref:THAP domain-containing protein 1 n=1 Tax=Megalopta genalis TaxID=115081 RepID=UPI003FD558B8
MGRTCCVKNCKEKYSSATNVSFHQLPTNPDLRKQWVQKIKVEPSSCARVCSKHFTDDCFIQSAWSSRRVLKSDAIPNVASNAETNPEHNAVPNVVFKTEDIQVVDSVSIIVPKNETLSLETENILSRTSPIRKRRAYVGDFQNFDISSDKYKYTAIVNATIAKKNKRIKILMQKNRRLERRVKSLQAIVNKLKNNEMNTDDGTFDARCSDAD